MTARFIRLGFLAVLLALFAAEGAVAQDPAAAPADGTREGVAVHGHWTIAVVREGEVVERREFENALALGGQQHLIRTLVRRNSPGPWFILLEADGSGTLCANNEHVNGDDTDCTISESEAELTVSDLSSSTPFSLLLEGTETVTRDGNLQVVSTFQWWCPDFTAPADCMPVANNLAQFTRRILDSPIPVLNGDRVEVTVELSFS